MPIPENINREHIFQAIIQLNKNQLTRTQWVLLYDNNFYPVLKIIYKSNLYANGEELKPDSNKVITYMAVRYLINLRFEIMDFKTGMIYNEDNPF